MNQAIPMLVLGGRLPAPPRSRRVRPSVPYPSVRFGVSGISEMASAPPPSGDWASRSRHQYGWPVPYAPPARPETIARRSPWLYGRPYGLSHGLGDAVTQAGAITGSVVPVLPGVAAAVGSTIGIAAAAAIPLIGAAIAGITLGIEAILHSGCGQTCVITSDWANQAGSLLTQNMNAYLALQAPRAQSAQAAALANFDKVWNYLVQQCSQPATGTAGQRCITDRQAGACKWKASPGGWVKDSAGNWTYTPWGAAGSGDACWNWFAGMRDPIANDPMVVPDEQSAQWAAAQTQAVQQGTAMPSPGGSVVANTGTSAGFDSKTLFLLAGLGLAALALSQSGKGGN